MPPPTLRSLARKPIRTNDLVNFIEGAPHSTDQAIALVAAAWVERCLERVILSRLVRLKKQQYRELFIGSSPLASFAIKIKLAYAMRIIGPRVQGDLEIVKDIRNQFAHSFHPISFRTKVISRECRKLKTPELFAQTHSKVLRIKTLLQPDRPHPLKSRARFTHTCIIVSLALSGSSVRGPRPKWRNGLFPRTFLR
jgi:hypothetical protein